MQNQFTGFTVHHCLQAYLRSKEGWGWISVVHDLCSRAELQYPPSGISRRAPY